MSRTLYLAWRYLLFHRYKTAVLVASLTLILFLPVGLRVLVEQSAERLTARAEATPLLVGAKGSSLDLVLNALYFGSGAPERISYGDALQIGESGLATAIPVHTGFHARQHPIVGTTLEYFEFRGLALASGRNLALLGECVVGARVARILAVAPGDSVVSSPGGVFDLAGIYPLKMHVVGVLEQADSPDDDAIFVDLKTAWVIEGLGHGHQDLTRPEAAGGVLRREEGRVIANASVVEYNEITPDNMDSFHFHGDLSGFPVSAVIAVPPDGKSSARLQGRFEADDMLTQIVRPSRVMAELLATVLTVQRFVVAGAVLLGLGTAGTAALVFLLSLRLRRREMVTLHKIGASRSGVAVVMASEIVAVLMTGALLAALLTALTSTFGTTIIRSILRTWV
jgi:putative ABC transport system permease protein